MMPYETGKHMHLSTLSRLAEATYLCFLDKVYGRFKFPALKFIFATCHVSLKWCPMLQ
jgi:hypothetical protein